MRNEDEMINIIINNAKSDERVLAAYLKGSRTNPNVPKDIFRDFDVMYVVKEVESFIKDRNWIESFGNIALKQEQDDDFGYGEQFNIRNGYDSSYSWLLIFDDNNRIDIGVETVEVMKEGRNRNKLFIPLLDKIQCLPKSIIPTEEEFYIKKPTKKRYMGCCNEFYWALCDVAKGIARDELPFAMTIYNTLVKKMLENMLNWYIGIFYDFSVTTGKYNKYLKKYLPMDIYEEYVKTFVNADYEALWNGINVACNLFNKIGNIVAKSLGFIYPKSYETASKNYMKSILRHTNTIKNIHR